MNLQAQPQRHRHSSTCHRHPTKPITGFCASCLRERLAGIDDSIPQEEAPGSSIYQNSTSKLRRTKSCSGGSNHEGLDNILELRRKSCDVRARNTLSDLFSLDDGRKNPNIKFEFPDVGLEPREEDENVQEVRVCEKSQMDNDFEEEGDLKTMKEFIDLEWGNKKNAGRDFKDIAGSFWEAASVFSRKLKKWKQTQTKKKKQNVNNAEEAVKPSVTRLRETQSEVGEYGFGRRSCDTDPRLSIDAGRISVDDSRYSFDEPRASWDGYLIGKAYPRLSPLESVEEKVNLNSEGESCPGGSTQTRNYYADSLSWQRRRRSFDRSSSVKRAALVEVDEVKSMSNAKVSPETVGLFHGAKLLVTEKELRDSNWYSVKDYRLESTDSTSSEVGSAAGGLHQKGFGFKKSRWRRNLWNIWGLIQRRHETNKCGDEDESIVQNVDDGSLAESLQKLRRVANEPVSQRLIRSYSVSARNSCKTDGLLNGENGDEIKGVVGVKTRVQLALQRNRSARYSPSNLDHGLLRFYLTPLRSYGRSRSGISRLKSSNSTARAVL